MASNGFKDRVAIISMGCTKFRDHWDKSADDLVVDAVDECMNSLNGKLELIEYLPFELFKVNVILLSILFNTVNNVKAL